jgi:hypothetical protein
MMIHLKAGGRYAIPDGSKVVEGDFAVVADTIFVNGSSGVWRLMVHGDSLLLLDAPGYVFHRAR